MRCINITKWNIDKVWLKILKSQEIEKKNYNFQYLCWLLILITKQYANEQLCL